MTSDRFANWLRLDVVDGVGKSIGQLGRIVHCLRWSSPVLSDAGSMAGVGCDEIEWHKRNRRKVTRKEYIMRRDKGKHKRNYAGGVGE